MSLRSDFQMRNCTASRGWTKQSWSFQPPLRSSVSHRRGIAVGEDRGGSRATANHANYVRLSRDARFPLAAARFSAAPKATENHPERQPPATWRRYNGIERRSPPDLPSSRFYTLSLFPSFSLSLLRCLRTGFIPLGNFRRGRFADRSLAIRFDSIRFVLVANFSRGFFVFLSFFFFRLGVVFFLSICSIFFNWNSSLSF